MAADERTVNRRRLIRRLSELLDETNHSKISNNDIRRLIDNLDNCIGFLRSIEHYPKGVPLFHLVHALGHGHIGSALLDRYSEWALRKVMDPMLREKLESHLGNCTACQARLKFFEAQLIDGQHLRPADPNPPRQIHIDEPSKVGRSMNRVPEGMAISGYLRDE